MPHKITEEYIVLLEDNSSFYVNMIMDTVKKVFDSLDKENQGLCIQIIEDMTERQKKEREACERVVDEMKSQLNTGETRLDS